MSKNVRTEAVDHLFDAILSLENKEECYKFFEDVCTVNELLAFSQRYEVAKMLREQRTYLDIAEKTGASTATISRVNRSLNYGCDGYDMVFARTNVKPVEERNLFPALQIAVSQYRSRHEIAHRVKEMERELASRKIINRAKGLLMDYYHISDEEAYHKMQQTSMRRGILLTDVAQKVIKEIMVRKNMLS